MRLGGGMGVEIIVGGTALEENRNKESTVLL